MTRNSEPIPEITPEFVAALVAYQFPHWAGLSVTPVTPGGWDNRTFRLGDEMLASLPSHAAYVAQVEKEQLWLPTLAPKLPLAIPVPIARGKPGSGYPWPWSIYRWLDGEPAEKANIGRMEEFARDLAEFLRALYRIDTVDGPPPGEHNFFRGGPIATYDRETRKAISAHSDRVAAGASLKLWEAALASAWKGPNVWVHGDVAASNLLVREGRLAAVIDFGCCAVGDPACDLTIAWTLFTGRSREAFREAIEMSEETWSRARGWALWKALVLLHRRQGPPAAVRDAARVLAEVLEG